MEDEKTNELTAAERQFLLRLLAQVQINPLGDGAVETLALVRSIAEKVAPRKEG